MTIEIVPNFRVCVNDRVNVFVCDRNRLQMRRFPLHTSGQLSEMTDLPNLNSGTFLTVQF